MNAAAVTAIIVTYNTGVRLKECLYALAADPEVSASVIVDNGNPAAMRTWLDAFVAERGDFQLLRPSENLGFGRAVNVGVQQVQTEHILVLNPDAVLRWNSVCQMQATAEPLARPWIVGGRIFNLQGHEERGARRKQLTLWRALTRVVGWNTWTLESQAPPTEPVAMPVISGAFFLTSKASFDLLGGFDERYFLHVEDIDLCRRCRQMGGQVMYDPRAGALHYGATSDAPSQVVARYKADSLALYFRTYAKGPFGKLFVALAIPLIQLATRIRGR